MHFASEIRVVFFLTIVSILFVFTPSQSFASEKKVKGKFEMNVMLDTMVGFQRFSKDPITEVAFDGSSGGVLGESLPGTTGGPLPCPGQDIFGVYVPKLEIDITERINERVRLRADISFGRPQSGSFINYVVPSHAYAAVRLFRDYNVELVVGRFGLQAGYEPFRAYHNDTISWSIMWRGNLYPPAATGIQLSADLTDTFKFFFTASNGNIVDFDGKGNEWPALLSSLEWNWGSESHPNIFVFTP